MYIQDKVEEYADEVFTKLDNGAHIYFCGLKGMMPGIQDMLKSVCDEKGIDYDEWVSAIQHVQKSKWNPSTTFFQIPLLTCIIYSIPSYACIYKHTHTHTVEGPEEEQAVACRGLLNSITRLLRRCIQERSDEKIYAAVRTTLPPVVMHASPS